MESQYRATTEHPKYMSSNTAKGVHVKAQNKWHITNPSLGISAVLGLASVSVLCYSQEGINTVSQGRQKKH
jgi:hypothetical protein